MKAETLYSYSSSSSYVTSKDPSDLEFEPDEDEDDYYVATVNTDSEDSDADGEVMSTKRVEGSDKVMLSVHIDAKFKFYRQIYQIPPHWMMIKIWSSAKREIKKDPKKEQSRAHTSNTTVSPHFCLILN